MSFSNMKTIPEKILANVQVNLPFGMRDLYAEHFLSLSLNPEISIDAKSLDRADMEDFKELARAFQRKNLRISLHAPFMDLSPASPDSMIRRVSMDRMEHFLELVPIFKPVSVVCHAAWESRRYQWMREDWYNDSADFWKEIGRYLRRRDVKLCLENVYEEDPEDLLLLLDLLRSEEIGACLDTGHVSAFAKTRLDNWCLALKDLIAEVHLHDNRGDKDEHLGLGFGSIDFSPLKVMLYKMKKPPLICIEPHKEEQLFACFDWIAKELYDFF